MRIAYTKTGRTQGYDPANWGVAGGDWEAPLLLNRLARAYPEHEFVIVGHNDGANPTKVGLPPNVTNPIGHIREDIRKIEKMYLRDRTTEKSLGYIEAMLDVWDPILGACDAFVSWIGQNDTVNQPIPKVDGTAGLGNSREIYIRQVSYLHAWINSVRDQDPTWEPIWLCSDIWNNLKARDLKWPMRRRVVCQYDFETKQSHYRYGDQNGPTHYGFDDVARWHLNPKHEGCWQAPLHYEYAGLELGSCVPTTIEFNAQWEGRRRFGVMCNQSREASGRDQVLAEYIKPMFPDWIVGSWDEDRKQGLTIEPYPWHAIPTLMQTVRSSLCVPIKMTGSWATPKAWELFACGTVAFMHPRYDDQGHILPTLAQCDEIEEENGGRTTETYLARWLRVDSPAQLRKRIDHLNTNPQDWEWLVRAQRAVYNVAKEEQLCLKTIGNHLGIGSPRTSESTPSGSTAA